MRHSRDFERQIRDLKKALKNYSGFLIKTEIKKKEEKTRFFYFKELASIAFLKCHR